jgi:DNA primase
MKTRCPKCAKNNQDSSGDNLQLYNDGHAHCYACGYHVYSAGIQLLKHTLIEPTEPKTVRLPKDAHEEINWEALQWLSKYEITREEVIQYGLKWSDNHKLLIYPIYSSGPSPDLLAWQGRSFSNQGAKNWTEGPIHEIIVPLNLASKATAPKIVLVEDYISAIKVARTYTAICLFGSAAPTSWLKRLHILTDTLYFWMDNDKAIDSMALAKRAASINFTVKVIVTKYDPKAYTDDEIKEAIEG